MDMRKLNRKPTKAGFTLPEVVVTITLIAALAAVVVPAITNQLKKGDPVRTASDAQAIRGAVEQFLTDVRVYPNSMGQLTNAIRRSQKPLAGSVGSAYKFAAGDTVRWKGPYLTKDSLAVLLTGFNWKFSTKFYIDQLPANGVVNAATGTRFMVLKAAVRSGDLGAAALMLDQSYDDGNLLTGAIRYRVCSQAPACSNTSNDTLKVLLLPVS
jgi:prepilin-type N-terminal cleavage/methylation domain-containing protein